VVQFKTGSVALCKNTRSAHTVILDRLSSLCTLHLTGKGTLLIASLTMSSTSRLMSSHTPAEQCSAIQAVSGSTPHHYTLLPYTAPHTCTRRLASLRTGPMQCMHHSAQCSRAVGGIKGDPVLYFGAPCRGVPCKLMHCVV
jgi:hypothetical protein